MEVPVLQVSFCMLEDVETLYSMLMPALSSLDGGIDSDHICQNSSTLLSSSCKNGITPLAIEI